MADGTGIEWTDATWNPVTGCSIVSAGCTNCYAMKLAGTRMRSHPSRAGLTIDTKAGPVWNGAVRLNDEWLDQPLRWLRPRTIFVCAHSDLFYGPEEWIDRVFAVMAMCPHHHFQVLTKRAGRMASYMANPETPGRIARAVQQSGSGSSLAQAKRRARAIWRLEEWPLPRVWLGVSVEDQRAADERIPHLLTTPAAVRFLSCEPLLGAVTLQDYIGFGSYPGNVPGQCVNVDGESWHNADQKCRTCGWGYPDDPDFPRRVAGIDWVIAGGESGAGARPMHPDWVSSLRDQCEASGVPFFFKQWGDWAPVSEISEELQDQLYHPAPARYPEAIRRCKVDQCVLHRDGLRFERDEWSKDRESGPIRAFEQGHGAMTMMAIGKKRAGRVLRGAVHDGMPASYPKARMATGDA